jgi:hypothetical protein
VPDAYPAIVTRESWEAINRILTGRPAPRSLPGTFVARIEFDAGPMDGKRRMAEEYWKTHPPKRTVAWTKHMLL